jgi:ABC-2 type transport system permease protein
MSAPTSPIADLSYRNYGGPLESPYTRWWPIAVVTMKLGIKKKGFWAWAALAGWGYLLQIVIFYIVDVATPISQLVNGKNPILQNVDWRAAFVNGFSYAQLLLLIVALLIGTPTIANDIRANALLVYLSRPCTKLDYLFGKWLGIFIPITLILIAETLFFYADCALSFGSYGFVSKDPYLLLRVLPMCCVPGILHASLALGISSLFDQGRLAGAAYSAIYFITLFFTIMIGGIYVTQDSAPTALLRNLFYCSIDGLCIGMAKLMLGTDGASVFQAVAGPAARIKSVARPDFGFLILVFLGLSLLGVWVAYQRIKPVQVVSR